MFNDEEIGFQEPNAWNLGLLAAAGWLTPVMKREWFIDIDFFGDHSPRTYALGIRVFGFWVSLGFVVGEDTV